MGWVEAYFAGRAIFGSIAIVVILLVAIVASPFLLIHSHWKKSRPSPEVRFEQKRARRDEKERRRAQKEEENELLDSVFGKGRRLPEVVIAVGLVAVVATVALLLFDGEKPESESNPQIDAVQSTVVSSSEDEEESEPSEAAEPLSIEELLAMVQGRWVGTTMIAYDVRESTTLVDSGRGSAGTVLYNNELGAVSRENQGVVTVDGNVLTNSFEKSWSGYNDLTDVTHGIESASVVSLSSIDGNGFIYTQSPKYDEDEENAWTYKDEACAFKALQLESDVFAAENDSGTLKTNVWYLLTTSTGQEKLCWYREFDLGSEEDVAGGVRYNVDKGYVVKCYFVRE